MAIDLTLKTMRIRNLLSFGPEAEEIALGPLNVLIGPNTSGKSNLIEVISLLRSAPTDLAGRIVEGGGIDNWLWKGAEKKPKAEIEVTAGSMRSDSMPLRYRLAFLTHPWGGPLWIDEEIIETETNPDDPAKEPVFYYKFQNGKAVIVPGPFADFVASRQGAEPPRPMELKDIDRQQSVFSQQRDPLYYPELSSLGDYLNSIHIYRELNVDGDSPVRRLQRAELRGDTLLADGSNLSIVLNNLQSKPEISGIILERLKEFYPDVEHMHTRIQGGYVELEVHEKGLKHPLTAIRLSDGTLRYLCLLTVLCNPEPPPLVCIEEPELGLHPDILPKVAELLVEASERTQLIVTTHSDILVSAFSDCPESVLVCERDEKGTSVRRLESDRLEKWLEQYSLGELWVMGEIGGNRW